MASPEQHHLYIQLHVFLASGQEARFRDALREVKRDRCLQSPMVAQMGDLTVRAHAALKRACGGTLPATLGDVVSELCRSGSELQRRSQREALLELRKSVVTALLEGVVPPQTSTRIAAPAPLIAALSSSRSSVDRRPQPVSPPPEDGPVLPAEEPARLNFPPVESAALVDAAYTPEAPDAAYTPEAPEAAYTPEAPDTIEPVAPAPVVSAIASPVEVVPPPTPPPRLDPRPPVGDLAALRAWALALDLEAEVDGPVRLGTMQLRGPSGVGVLRKIKPALSVGELLADQGSGRAAAWLKPALRSALTSAVMADLESGARAAITRLVMRERMTEFALEAGPEMAGLLTALRTARKGIVGGGDVMRRELAGAVQTVVGFGGSPARLRLRVSVPGTEWINVSVGLDALPGGPLDVACACGSPRCESAAYALDRLMEWVITAEDAERSRLASYLAAPAWRRLLALLDPPDTRPTDAARDVEPSLEAFRLTLAAGELDLTPVQHRRLKSGAWSAAMRSSLGNVAYATQREAASLALRRAALILMSRSYEYEGDPNCTFDALELLAGSGRVYLEGGSPDHPLDLRVEHAGLKAQTNTDGSVRLVETLDGVEIPPGTESHRAGDARRIFLWRSHNRCVLARVSDELQRATAVLARPGTSFPREAVSELAARLGGLVERGELDLPPELLGERLEADLRPCLRLEIRDGALTGEARVRPDPAGASLPAGEGRQRLIGALNGRPVYVERDFAAELSSVETLLASLPGIARSGTHHFSCPGEEPGLDLLAHLASRGDLTIEWIRPAEARRVVGTASASGLRVEVVDRTDWFGVAGGMDVNGHPVSLADLLEAVRLGRRYVRAGAGEFVEIAAELRERLLRAADVVYSVRGELQAGLAAVDALSDLCDAAGEAARGVKFRSLVARLRASTELDPEPPHALTATLRSYQLDGYRWLMRLASWGVGGCLADDMGLGKTVQALAAIVARAAGGPTLVVAPTSVCWNWVSEARRFAPSLNVHLFRETDRAGDLDRLGPNDLLVTSYGLATRHAEELARRRFVTLILDEAQAIKNADTRRARAVRSLDAEWRVALTGTPVENHVGELWSLMRVVTPGLLGSVEQFRERFGLPIERDRDMARRRALAQVVRPFLLRRLKSEVAPELPPRTEIRRVVPLSPEEWKHYDAVRLAIVAALAGDAGHKGAVRDEQKRFQVLAAITRLRQLACHPRLIDDTSPLASAKLASFLELVDELRDGGHRALVFSQFTSHLALVEEALRERGISFLYLDGHTSEAERKRRVEAFQGGEGELFLISLKAGGTGLNLTAADYVVHLDPWWNPAVEDQATDRAHRIGQDKPVTVYRLVSQGTIEEAILSLHERKRDLSTGILDGTDSAGKLSTEDLIDMIRSGERI